MNGLIIKSTGSRYKVLKEEDSTVIDCVVKGRFRINRGLRTTNPVAVGDRVDFDIDPKTNLGVITYLHDRKNYLMRSSINLSKEYQIIAANVDHIYLMISMMSPETPLEFIDRFLVSAEAYRIPVSIIINKIDIYDNIAMQKAKEVVDIYSAIGYSCYMVSLKNGEGDIPQLFEDKKIFLLSGNSGVGKSTFINLLDPSLNVKTGEVSEYHQQGKHITTFPEMFILSSGAGIIDSPGIRGFGLANIEREEIYHFFPEIFKTAAQCRFHNCLHIDEPGCSVVSAVERGEISASRYLSYLNMVEEENTKYRQ